MNSTTGIRVARPEDYDAILAITRSDFPASFSVEGRLEDVAGGVSWHVLKANRVLEELRNNPEACAVAEYDRRVVGYITGVIDRPAGRGIISNLVVTRNMQGKGIGRSLIEWALALFRGMGLQQAKIETLDTNDAGRHLYPKLGFHEAARQIHYVMPLRPSK